jgi:integrase
MKTADASIYLDTRPKANGERAVKIRVTFNRKRKYFSTGIDLTKEDFEKVMYSERKKKNQKEVFTKLNYFLSKASKVINELKVFTFDVFEEYFLEQRNAHDSVSFAFDSYSKSLRLEGRISTAVSYECARNSLSKFKKDLTFADVTPAFLKKYENHMTTKGNSTATVGIYLRSLRAVYNLQKIDKSIYPFGNGNDEYSIPTGKNTKKALTIEEIGSIYNYKTEPNSIEDMAKDYWLFLYLCNGMNVKDLCKLRWSNIDNDILTFVREKTKRTTKETKNITVALKPETMAIIKKWGQPSTNKDLYIFPHLTMNMTPTEKHLTAQLLTEKINKNIKSIAIKVGINKNVTTYYARHSFATILKRSGADISMISDLLGHSSMSVTESYLDSFEKEQIQEKTNVLTSSFNKAN